MFGIAVTTRINVATFITLVNKRGHKIAIDKKIFCGYDFDMPRPKLNDDDRRDKPLRVRLTPAERETIDTAAAYDETDSSKWARTVLLRIAEKSIQKHESTGKKPKM